jgi:hypothetical protein
VQALPDLVMGLDGKTDPAKLAKFLDQGGLQAFQAEDNPDLLEIEREHAMYEAFDPELGDGTMQDLGIDLAAVDIEDPAQFAQLLVALAEFFPVIGFWNNHQAHQIHHEDTIKRDWARMQRWHPIARKAFLDHTLKTRVVLEQIVSALTPDAPGAESGPAKPGAQKTPGTQPHGSTDARPKDTKLTTGDFAAAGSPRIK